ncbi:hypothetical protein AAE02nite_12070 [Adhaeribacter aerolatus]|uniref:PH domain-containing protein n=1 Tax=Adhaeribacter aerolatus TaxID=670289 RepID=A0A512AV27_9BACT|nr:hypothetical protein [Adhaeribacter aerolatus]GEO03543.1 hypothetical protein AAE02nite_12070 [Adhaeribacter aerolatus]
MDTSTEYSLKLASKTIQKATTAFIILFWIVLFGGFFVLDVLIGDFPLPTYLAKTVIQLIGVFLFASIVTAVAFAFYRKPGKVILNEQGIQLPHYPFISWESIQWYRIDQFSSNSNTKRVEIKVNGGKAVILAEENEPLFQLAADISQRLRIHNPAAKDFRELKSSKIKAIILILIFTAIHLAIIIQTNFDKKYIIIFTPVLLVTIWAILLDHLKKPTNQS